MPQLPLEEGEFVLLVGPIRIPQFLTMTWSLRTKMAPNFDWWSKDGSFCVIQKAI